MPKIKKFVVWTWFEDSNHEFPMYVGWGVHDVNHPAKRLWAKRHGAGSPLNDWLRTYKYEPIRVDHGGIVGYYCDEAQSVAAVKRQSYRAAGHELKSTRPYGTKTGGGAARPIMAPDLTIFQSVRAAATDVGVSPCTITRWCQSDDSGWDYLD